MNIFQGILCALVLAASAACSGVTAFGGPTADDLKQHVTYMASDDLGGRAAASEGYDLAATYVKDKCTEYGLKVEYQKVPLRSNRSCKNVIAWIEGENPDAVVVVGAHLDHVGYNRSGRVMNGADDNASGSAILLALAKRFAKAPKPPCTIAFQWYTAEERGLVGSRYYANNPTLPKSGPDISKHVFMLNLDMVGRLKSAERFSTFKDTTLEEVLAELYKKYPFAGKITLRNSSLGSDHIPFKNAGIQSVFLHTGLHSDYHKYTDDTEKLNYEGMVKIGNYAFDLLNKVIGTEPDYVLWGNTE
jgi:Zn-dependent M28 family amino/carboxypeptidase